MVTSRLAAAAAAPSVGLEVAGGKVSHQAAEAARRAEAVASGVAESAEAAGHIPQRRRRMSGRARATGTLLSSTCDL